MTKIIEKIRRGELPRAELAQLLDNARGRASSGDKNALAVIQAINDTGVSPADRQFAFIGFCPGGDIANRLDRKWISEGICEFGFFDSPVQHRRFKDIMVGDRLILKKREAFGATMRLYGHGRVSEILKSGERLRVEWTTRMGEILVPLMGCNSTVDVRLIERVEREAPEEFWHWLDGKPT